jgi:hypothetical protein
MGDERTHKCYYRAAIQHTRTQYRTQYRSDRETCTLTCSCSIILHIQYITYTQERTANSMTIRTTFRARTCTIPASLPSGYRFLRHAHGGSCMQLLLFAILCHSFRHEAACFAVVYDNVSYDAGAFALSSYSCSIAHTRNGILYYDI